VTNVQPIRLNETALTAAMLGLNVRHSGYGVTDGNTQVGSGTKREVVTPLRRVMSSSFESGAPGKQTCQGDSGGPAFMVLPGTTDERLVGVVSYGDQGCTNFGVDMRVDTVIPWIRQTASAWEEPTCEIDGLCKPGCAVVDQDCACAADGQCTAECLDFSSDVDCPANCGGDGICAVATCPRADADCVAEGALCTAATQCQGRQCVNDAQNKDTYCSRPCGSTSECGASMECVQGACRIPPRPERQLFDSCSPMLDFCVTSTCNGPRAGITRCVLPCNINTDCGDGSMCEAGAMGGRFCRPANLDFIPKTVPGVLPQLGEVAKGCSSAPGGLLMALVLLLPLSRRRRS
jgi:MYXO-CTERM domain-containing protein